MPAGHLLQEIGSCSYGGWEVSWSAVCKLKTPESQWYNSVQVQRPENWGAYSINPSLRTEDEMKYHSSSSEKGENPSFLPLLFYPGPHRLDDVQPHGWRQSTLPRSPVQMLISSRSTLIHTHMAGQVDT